MQVDFDETKEVIRPVTGKCLEGDACGGFFSWRNLLVRILAFSGTGTHTRMRYPCCFSSKEE